jgi:hypothetical protein
VTVNGLRSSSIAIPTACRQNFNLLLFFDAPAAFGCPLAVHGTSFWHEPFIGAPKIATSSGDGAVPVWFVPLDAVNQATQDGFLSIGELARLEGLLSRVRGQVQ